MPRILDIGCGRKKYPGSIGIDRSPAGQADVLCDWERALPFIDSSFDQARLVHIIEEVDDIFRVLGEVHRVSKPGARVISHDYAVPGWKPTQIERADDRHVHLIYLYEMPASKVGDSAKTDATARN